MLTFGGGSAVVPICEQEVVNKLKWITKDEYYEIVTMANMLPGASMVEISAGIGYKQYGLGGAIVSAVGVTMPGILLFVFGYTMFNNFFMENDLTSLLVFVTITIGLSIFMTGYNMLKSSGFDFTNLLIFILSLISLVLFNINPSILIMLSLMMIVLYVRVVK